MKFFEFINLINDQNALITYLTEHGILKNSVNCQRCGRQMTVQNRNNSIDGQTFRCSNCKSRKSIRAGSFIEDVRLPLQKIASMVYLLNIEILYKHIAEILEINEKTVIDFATRTRKEKAKYLVQNARRLGGPGIRVQVNL
jgi:transposase-like protein